MTKKICFLLFVLFSMQGYAQTGIGTSTPHASAKLDVTSTTMGFLPPRMTSVQRLAISNPAEGLMVYQTDGTTGLYYRGATDWIYIINSTNNVLPVLNGGTGTTTSTGSGSVVLGTSPTLVTPTLGIATGTSLSLSSTTASTSTTTGALTVSGGIGVGGDVRAANFIGNGSQITGVPTNITYGEINVPQNLNVNSSGNGFTNLVDIPLPSAGTYRITYIARVSVANTATLSVLLLRNGLNAQVTGSEATPIFNLAGVQVMSTMTTYVTISGEEIYKFTAWVQAGAGTLQIINDGNGRSKVFWEKIK